MDSTNEEAGVPSGSRSSAMHKRMEMPLGAKPAATVLRRSAPGKTTISKTRTAPSSKPSEEHPAAAAVANEQPASEPSMLGSIVERPRRSRSTNGDGTKASTKRASRFAQSRQTGFPPTKNIPLGSLVASSSKQSKPNETKDLQHPKTPSDDAQSLLAGMSVAEIQESVEELHSSLDPSMIAFLKARGKKKDDNKQTVTDAKTEGTTDDSDARLRSRGKESVPDPLSTAPAVPITASTVASSQQKREKERNNDKMLEEKVRMDQVLSSIQTYDDLDAAYEAAYQQQHTEDLDGSSLNNNNNNNNNVIGGVALQGREDDFGIACGLLRSTSPQQTLWASRVVCRRLQREVQVSGTAYCLVPQSALENQNSWPFPTLLPVSLRCLLDANVSRGGGGLMLQTTYVLQSLYALLQLRACSDHNIVDITGMDDSNEAICYQLNMLDDAVPSPSLKSCYAALPIKPLVGKDATNFSSSSDVAGAAYSTSSSPTSAQADGEAFVRDPMWTLLSRMRILPRISHLVRRGSSVVASASNSGADHHVLPKEALVAICGILAMIGQRSPGAATAIAHHPSLLDDLTSLLWVKYDGSSRYDPSLALPTIVLMCTLARQSRAAAESIANRMVESTFLLELLASKRDNSAADYRLHHWTIVLWRTLLRYGLCLTVLPTILTLAAQHLALGNRERSARDQALSTKKGERLGSDLSPEFYTCFGVVLHCIRVLNMPRKASRSSAGSQVQGGGQNGDNLRISDDERSIISEAGVWLSASKQQAIRHLKSLSESVAGNWSSQDCKILRSVNGILRFLCALIDSAEGNEDVEYSCSGEYKTKGMTLVEEESCIDALDGIVQSECMREVLDAVLPYCAFSSPETSLGADALTTATFECCASAFLDSVLRLVSSLQIRCSTFISGDDLCLKEKTEQLSARLGRILTSYLATKVASSPQPSLPSTNDSQFGTARQTWLNHVHVSVLSFLREVRKQEAKDDPTMKGLLYRAIGRLQLGEEREALILFELMLFHSSATRADQKPSPISRLLIRELCRTPRAQLQLDHSFRLSGGLGMLPDATGAFGLHSLLSEAEDREPGADSSEHLLPLGEFWLWQLLSGSVVSPPTHGGDDAIEDEDEAVQVLSSVLQIIQEIEEPDCVDGYARSLNTGAKLYYIVSMCLHPEHILANSQITARASGLVEKYVRAFAASDAKVFGEVCRKHSATKTSKKTEAHSAAEEAHVKAILEPPSSATLRSIEALVDDLTDAYLDYGAQYPFFTKCLRLFLANGFPAKIRCTVIQRLRGALHLLSLGDDTDLVDTLPSYLSGGLPSVDNSVRDPPELLDCIATVFSRGALVRPDDSFFSSWAVAMLAKSFAISMSHGSSSGLSASKRRIQSLDGAIFLRVVQATAFLLSREGTIDDLVVGSLQGDSSELCCPPVDFSVLKQTDEVERWDKTVNILRGILLHTVV